MTIAVIPGFLSVIPGLTGNLCEQSLLLLRQLISHPVLVDLADVHFHGSPPA